MCWQQITSVGSPFPILSRTRLEVVSLVHLIEGAGPAVSQHGALCSERDPSCPLALQIMARIAAYSDCGTWGKESRADGGLTLLMIRIKVEKPDYTH